MAYSHQPLAAEKQSDQIEILQFYLNTRLPFGINVLKVKEIIPVPNLTQLPNANPVICGVANLRGTTLPVIDLAKAIGQPPTADSTSAQTSVIITEFNRGLHGFLVNRVDRIVYRDWKEILPPPNTLGTSTYTSGVTRENDALVQILDLERIIATFDSVTDGDYARISTEGLDDQNRCQRILVVDDSAMARAQTVRTLDSLRVPYVMARDGKDAMDVLLKLNGDEADPAEAISLVLSDIEMPEMDGYSLTQQIRKTPSLANLYILLHTSLNGAINAERAEKCGANAVLTKFVPEELATQVIAGLKQTTDKDA
ncbi:Chemotaxis protein CheV [hydrothermal vent metagenome]|uniref:Chemotaxis protein CheV n=1 Tax=hydrothermal vent metagenome TaxID=652676 RepID=A0A3B1BAN3_9ZZZZ